MIPVVVESPFKGNEWQDTERNRVYLELCLRDCIERGETPYAWHSDPVPLLADDEPPEPVEYCTKPSGNFRNCNVPGVRVCEEHKCRCRQPREPAETLPEVPR